MNINVYNLLKDLNLHKQFLLMLVLRLPFDFLNSLLQANMLERFIRLIELNKKEEILQAFCIFLLLSIFLFAYNMTVWMTISIKADILLQKRLRKNIMSSLLSCTEEEMEKLSAGDWITRLNNDIDKVNAYLTTPLNYMHMMIAALNLLLSSIVLIFLNISLFVIAILVMVPFFFLSSVIIIRKVSFFRLKAQKSFANYTNWLEPIVSCRDALLIFDGKEIVEQKTEELSLEILHQNMQAHKRISLTYLFNTFSGNLGYILLLLAGNNMIGNGIESFAELSKITQYRGEMMKSVMCINNCIGNMRSNYPSVERVKEVRNISHQT